MKAFVHYTEPDNTVEFDKNRVFHRVSRWITIKTKYNTRKNHSLYDYVTDEYGYHPYDEQFDPTNGTFLDFFEFRGCKFAIEQFARFGGMMCPVTEGYVEGKKLHPLAGVDMDNIWSPYYIELDETGEHVRLYELDGYSFNDKIAR